MEFTRTHLNKISPELLLGAFALFHFFIYDVKIDVPVAAAEIMSVGTNLIANVAIVKNRVNCGESVGVNEACKTEVFPSL